MTTTARLLSAVGIFLVLCSAVRAQEFDSDFPVHRDGRYVLTGTGWRKKFIIKVYAMGFYVDEAAAKKAWAGHTGTPQAFLINGDFDKLGVLRFARDVEAAKIREAYVESLEEALSDKAPADERQAAQAFVALFDHDMKTGEEIHIRTSPDGQVTVTLAGKTKQGPKLPRLVKDVWAIWLGAHPISEDLKKGLVARIDSLK
jgi:hypothetical protein